MRHCRYADFWNRLIPSKIAAKWANTSFPASRCRPHQIGLPLRPQHGGLPLHTRALKGWVSPSSLKKENINSLEEDSELRITLSGAFAQSEQSISANVTWGKRRAMESGKATISTNTSTATAGGADDKPEIIPEEAEVVRWIYERYLAGPAQGCCGTSCMSRA